LGVSNHRLRYTCGPNDYSEKKLGQFDSLDESLVPKNTHIEESN